MKREKVELTHRDMNGESYRQIREGYYYSSMGYNLFLFKNEDLWETYNLNDNHGLFNNTFVFRRETLSDLKKFFAENIENKLIEIK